MRMGVMQSIERVYLSVILHAVQWRQAGCLTSNARGMHLTALCALDKNNKNMMII